MNFIVTGMSCGHCVRAVTSAVQKLDADASVEVDLAASSVTVHSQKADAEAVEAAIAAADYDVTSRTN